MRKLLNTLYVTTPDAYLSKDGLNVVVSVKQKELFRIPIVNIESVVIFGYMGVSPGLMKLCVDYNVALIFLSPNGKFIGRLKCSIKGNVLLRTRQWSLAKDEQFTLSISKLFISGKIQNYRNILSRFLRDNGSNDDVKETILHLKLCKEKVLNSTDLDYLRGVEGEAANRYFGILPQLILQQKEDFVFTGRNRRPPKDAVNIMLSFAYTLIASDITSALETIGLDPYVGFLHTLRSGRPALSLDMMEEFRAYLGDRFVLSLINRKQLSIKNFIQHGDNSVVISDEGRKIILTAWQNRKKETIIHPYLGDKVPIGLLPYVQAMLFARYLRGELDNYPVFLIN